MNFRFTVSLLATGVTLAPCSSLRAEDHLSDTEKATAIIAVGALAAVAAHAAQHDQGPAYHDYGKVVVVNISNTAGERVPVYLYPRNGGWFGPRGEFYRTMPNVKYLAAVYGNRRPDGGARLLGRDQGGGYQDVPLQAKVERGQVRIIRSEQTLRVVRTALPNIENCKFVNDQQQLVVKSRGNHGPAMVEKFNTRTGVLEDKVMAAEIRKSGAKWARGFED